MIWFLGIAAAAASVLGGIEFWAAEDDQEQAESLMSRAKSAYEDSEDSLKKSYDVMEKNLLKLSYKNKELLDGPMARFLKSYEKIRRIDFKNPVSRNVIKEYNFTEEDIANVRELTNIYSDVLTSGATGAVAGAAIALTASGSLSLVASGLSLAGSWLAIGELGTAAEIAGSALSFGAFMTPLSALVGPAVLFAGFSAFSEASDNLEKAEAAYAEAQAAIEKMKIWEDSYNAVSEMALMYNDLLTDLGNKLSKALPLFEQLIEMKEEQFPWRKLTLEDFSEEETDLIVATRTIAGEIKTILNTPIVNSEGKFSDKSRTVYNRVRTDMK